MENSRPKLPRILIYGVNEQAATLYTMIGMERQAVVDAFIIDREYRKNDTYLGKPVVDSDLLCEMFPSEKYSICLSFGYKNMMYNRKEKFYWCKERGYKIYTFISRNAVVYTENIGEGSNIYPGTILSPYVKIGKGSFIESGCVIAHHTEIGEFNFIAPGGHFCGDIKTGPNCFFGSASEITNGCNIGKDVFVAAAAKVSQNVDEGSAILLAKAKHLPGKSFDVMERMFNE